MILERTVYDVKCSQCWRLISCGHKSREDAEAMEREMMGFTGVVDHPVMCPVCLYAEREKARKP
jgi:hypothetical protein